MKQILKTDANNWAALIARVAVFVVIFPHGAQKMLGWFGGKGFHATIDAMTHGGGLPWIVVFLVIVIEFFGAIFLLLGLFTRVAALAIVINFVGVVFTAIIKNGFFMNWGSIGGKGEGLEYFVLLFGLLLICLCNGGGKASIDAHLCIQNRIQ